MASAFREILVDRSGNASVAVSGQGGENSASLFAMAGCEFYADIASGCDTGVLPLTFSLSGKAPQGVKLSKDGILQGTPARSGDYAFAVVATDSAGNRSRLEIAMSVASLEGAVAGSFTAMLSGKTAVSTADGESVSAAAGCLEVSVSAAGKVSAKVVTAAGTKSFAPSLVWTPDYAGASAGGTFALDYEKTTSGKSRQYFHAELGSGAGVTDVIYEESAVTAKTATETTLSGQLQYGDAAAFKDNDFRQNFLGRYYTVVLMPEKPAAESAEDGCRTPAELVAPGYLTLTTDRNGGVKVGGKLPDGTAVSGSGRLLPSSDFSNADVLLFLVPSTYKKQGYLSLELMIDADGAVESVSKGMWVVPPLYSAALDEYEGGVEGGSLPGRLDVSASGAFYSPKYELDGYYDVAMEVKADETPMLEYSYTEEGEKRYDRVPGVTDIGTPEFTWKNGKITVAKSPAPWKDSEGVWHYDVTKEDRSGETKAITNPLGLSVSFNKATGVFTGKFTAYFDYWLPKYNRNGDDVGSMQHKGVSVPYAGVVVHSDAAGGAFGRGSALYTGKQTLTLETEDARGRVKTKTATFSRKLAIEVGLSF